MTCTLLAATLAQPCMCLCLFLPRGGVSFFGTLPDVNTFRVSAKDLRRASNLTLALPGFVAAVKESLRTGKALPKTSVVINVLYDEDFTDPSVMLDSSRSPATTVNLTSIRVSGLFSEPVSVVTAG